MRRKNEVPVKKLRLTIDPEKLGVEDTSGVEPLKNYVGQERAIQSLIFGLEIEAPGYNIFATGINNSGRTSLIRQYLKQFAEKKKKQGQVNLKDICYVHNFAQDDKPRLLVFAKGEGWKFQEKIEQIEKSLKKKIPAVFQSKEYLEGKDQLDEIFSKKVKKLNESLDKKMRELHFRLGKSGGTVLMSRQNPEQPMKKQEFKNLTKEERQKIEEDGKKIGQLAKEQVLQLKRIQKTVDELLDNLEKTLVGEVIEIIFEELNYEDAAVLEFLTGLKNFVLKNIDLFDQSEENGPMPGLPIVSPQKPKNGPDKLLAFMVNVLVDNSGRDAPPVIFENHPTFAKCFGVIEREVIHGGYFTDHTLIKAGSLALANGGYLVVNALDLLINPGVWSKLKKTLMTGFLKIDDIAEYFGLSSMISLNPEAIPINVKVIAIGRPFIYWLLTQHDKDFLKIFKVKAEFDCQMKLGKKNLKSYAAFVALVCEQEKLLPFNKSAVAKIVEYGIRLADDQKKLSTQFGKVKDLVVEANYYAKKSKAKKVKVNHVTKAIEQKRQRLNLTEERYQEYIDRGILLIDTDKEKVGQINGLSVYQLGDFSFGAPTKITAETFMGKRGVISIQREVRLSGPIHNTGVLILSGYLGAKYAQDKPLSLSASLCFEQSYGGVEGDSATAAELLAIISSLANTPINQAIAITGSMNQKGEIQPIGGVNQKIEGFFDICRKKGLTGQQGIVIPASNLDHLMLREDVVEAVAKGQFHVYSAKTIDQAIEILTGRSAKKVHDSVNKRLKTMSEIGKEKERSPTQGRTPTKTSEKKKSKNIKEPLATEALFLLGNLSYEDLDFFKIFVWIKKAPTTMAMPAKVTPHHPIPKPKLGPVVPKPPISPFMYLAISPTRIMPNSPIAAQNVPITI